MKRTRVCPHITRDGRSCPNLQPCPIHARDGNARWSSDRDGAAQARFRKAVLKRDRYTCRRCGHHDRSARTLVAHHDRAGYDPAAGRTLCTDCHRQVDSSAR